MKDRQGTAATEKSSWKRRMGRMLLLLLVIVLTAMEILWAASLWYAHREMMHELRRDSQWVEGAVNGYYDVLGLTILHTEALAAAWWLWIRGLRKRKGPEDVEKRVRPHGWLCVVLALVAVACVLLAIAAYADFEASLPNIDGGLGYFLGDARQPQIIALLAVSAWLICTLRWTAITLRRFLKRGEENTP